MLLSASTVGATVSTANLRHGVECHRLHHPQPELAILPRVIPFETGRFVRNIESSAEILDLRGEGVAHHWNVVALLPLIDLEPELGVGDELGVGQWLAGERTGVVAAVEPFHDGLSLEVDAHSVHQGIVHELQSERADEFIGGVCILVAPSLPLVMRSISMVNPSRGDGRLGGGGGSDCLQISDAGNWRSWERCWWCRRWRLRMVFLHHRLLLLLLLV
mmetsp:Transcript_9457/g.25673  ORF Transcript_9457/g.25673 Transcript_9457/m.25673 type:complete len:218 (-) Transcript_9457:255-908(-)